MADKSLDKNNVEIAEEANEEKDVEVAEDEDSKSETGDKIENGEPEEKSENGKEPANGTIAETDDSVCNVKRKSTGDVSEDTSATDGATPEKKAKLDKVSTKAESNGDAKVKA